MNWGTQRAAWQELGVNSPGLLGVTAVIGWRGFWTVIGWCGGCWTVIGWRGEAMNNGNVMKVGRQTLEPSPRPRQ
ncbi:hypothetical protein E2C01_093683 [Portunus trituberculatus]|uniref:Uncharacterized protein n=1 Tax=Portunus trituberculatus TaxID=210409 RepID=A0A5B7JYU0_PORTR|nr:hypothetical protein [Portunus trituberculatus]